MTRHFDPKGSFDEWMEINVQMSEALHAALPPTVLDAIDKIIYSLSEDLGTSDEAWRGAVEFAYQCVCIMQAGFDFTEANLMTNAYATAMLLLVTRFLGHPRTTTTLRQMLEEGGI